MITYRIKMAQEWKTGGVNTGSLTKKYQPKMYGQKRYTSIKAVNEILKSLKAQGIETVVIMEGEYTVITA